jgi:hypothetical protein
MTPEHSETFLDEQLATLLNDHPSKLLLEDEERKKEQEKKDAEAKKRKNTGAQGGHCSWI